MFSSIDPAVLARIQFAANMSFHILFPAINIAHSRRSTAQADDVPCPNNAR
jgi:hypothetical protein